MGTPILQTAFSGGEISPALLARIDVDKRVNGARSLKNFFVKASGGASNRAGFEFTYPVHDDSEVARLVGFTFNAEQTYALLFQDLKMQVIKDGVPVTETPQAITGATQANPVVITDVAHPFANDDDVLIKDIVGMEELNGRFFTIANKTANTYELVGEDGTGYGAYSSGGTGAKVFTLVTTYLEEDLFGLNFTQSADVMTIVSSDYLVRTLNRLADDNWTLTVVTFAPALDPPTGVAAVVTTGSAGQVNGYVVTSVDDATGEESIASFRVTADNKFDTDNDSNTISWNTVVGASSYNIYKDLDGTTFYGFIGRSSALSFRDRDLAPEFGDTPAITVRDPFVGVGNTPATAAYHQQRLWYAQTDNNPQTVFGSVLGNFDNMNVSKTVSDDDAITVTVAGVKIDEIRHLVPLKNLILTFTAGSEWVMRSTSVNLGLTPFTTSFDPQTAYGSSNLAPLVIGASVLFVTDKGNIIRDSQFTLEADGYDGSDLTILADHLFTDFETIDWAYQQAPHSLVWVVRSDGAALCLTYQREHSIWAWTLIETDGKFESVISVQEGEEDAVYFVIRRKIGGVFKRFVERLHSRTLTSIKNAFFVDAGVSLDVPISITGATQADPVVITTPGHSIPNGQIIDISDVEGMTQLNGNRYKAASVTGTTLELQSAEDVPVDIDGTGFDAYDEGGFVREAVTTVSGLRHLEGKTVNILGDGSVVTPRVVADGAITLDVPASRVHVGLPYTADLNTLDLIIPKVAGKTIQTSEASVFWEKSAGGLIGQDEGKLDPIERRTIEGPGDPTGLDTSVRKHPMPASWEDKGRVFIRQSDPLPLTVLGVIPEADFGN